MSLNEFEKGVLNAYRNGVDVGQIARLNNTTYDAIKDILMKFKEINRNKRIFTNEFKRVIADRDINGISRRQISLELEINASTVKRACEQFGRAFKEKPSPTNNEYTIIEGDFNILNCPTCGSRRVNEIDHKITYCMECGNEHIYKTGYVLKVNWEYLD